MIKAAGAPAKISFKSLQGIAIASIKNNGSLYKSGQGRIFVNIFIDVVKTLAQKKKTTLLISENRKAVFSLNKIPREELIDELSRRSGWSKEVCQYFLEKLEAKINSQAKKVKRLIIEDLGNISLIAGQWRLFL